MFAHIARRVSFTASVLLALPVALGAQSAAANAATAGTAVNSEAITDPSSTYYACYAPSSGTVYRIKTPDTRATCTKPSHVEFSWTAQKASGWSQVTMTPGSEVSVAPGWQKGASAECPAGTTRISGGYSLSNFEVSKGIPVVLAEYATTNGWGVNVYNPAASVLAANVIAYASCAK